MIHLVHSGRHGGAPCAGPWSAETQSVVTVSNGAFGRPLSPIPAAGPGVRKESASPCPTLAVLASDGGPLGPRLTSSGAPVASCPRAAGAARPAPLQSRLARFEVAIRRYKQPSDAPAWLVTEERGLDE